MIPMEQTSQREEVGVDVIGRTRKQDVTNVGQPTYFNPKPQAFSKPKLVILGCINELKYIRFCYL